MGKLIFKYGTMSSGKTLHLLSMANNLKENGIKYQLLKPEIDTRSVNTIKSRIGIEDKCDVFKYNEDLYHIIDTKSKFILVDEAQFLSTNQVNQLAYFVDYYNIDIICYGLRTDYLTNMFEGSKRLFEISDEITELISYCKCGNKTSVNARKNENGDLIIDSDENQIEIGGNEKYVTLCRKCYIESVNKNTDYADEID